MRKSIKSALALVLALAMVMAMSVVTFAADAKATATSEKTDAGYTVTLSITGPIGSFDYGVTYDSSKLAVSKTKWNADFTGAYDEVDGIKAKNDQKEYGYVVFGGTCNGEADYSGAVGIIEFTVVEGATVTEEDVVVVVADSKALKDEVDAAGEPAPLSTAASYESKVQAEVKVVPPTPTPEPTADPTDKPADPTDKPADPTDKPADPTDKPADPTDKPADPTKAPAPATADTASVVIPMIAIVGAAAAVVVASKKRVEE